MGSLEIDYKQIVLENVTSTFDAQTLKVHVNTASVGAKTIFVKNIQQIYYIYTAVAIKISSHQINLIIVAKKAYDSCDMSREA